MFLTLGVRGDSAVPATDVGFVLHKHPQRVQQFATSQGTATVFYPIATDDRCEIACHVDGFDVGRRDRRVASHVNPIPYEASSRFVVALGKVFGDALAGRCNARPELVNHRWELSVNIAAVPYRGSIDIATVFEPLGWTVQVDPASQVPEEWGSAEYARVRLRGVMRIVDALRHLSVLLPVIAGGKHYFVDDTEADKLLRLGAEWLATHPAREQIVRTYLTHLPGLAAQLVADLGNTTGTPASTPEPGARPSTLAVRRREVVTDLVAAAGARRVLDVGCGEGRLLATLARDGAAPTLAGVDVSASALTAAARRLERWPHVTLWQSSLGYTDPRCRGFDVVVAMEVIEHIDADRLPSAMATLFDDMAPSTIIITTPNRDHNPLFGLASGQLRHPDHRFEFSAAEFVRWTDELAHRYRYSVVRGGITAAADEPGAPQRPDENIGAPTQYAVFTRTDTPDSTQEVRG